MLRKFNYGKGNKQVEQSKVLHSLRDVVSKKEEEWKMKGLLTKKNEKQKCGIKQPEKETNRNL